MILHFLFLVIHLVVSAIGDPVLSSLALLVHCFTFILKSIFYNKSGKITVMPAFAAGAAIVALANTLFTYRISVDGLDTKSTYGYTVMRFVADSTTLYSIGTTFTFIGYELFSKRSLPKIGFTITSEKTVKLIFQAAAFVGILNVTGNMVNLGFISGGVQKLLTLFGDMSLLFFARLWGIGNNTKYRNYGLILCALQLMYGLFVGFLRIQLVLPVIIFYGGYFLGKRNVKYIFTYRSIPAIIILGLFASLFGTLGAYRSHFSDAFSSTSSAAETPGYTIESIENSDRGNVLIRASNIGPLSNIFELVERKGFYNGQASLPLAFALIPRALWPDKPSIELGTWFALEIGVATISAGSGRANNSINMSIPGELYLDFGWVGVILGCLLCGGLLAFFWNAADFSSEPFDLIGTLWGGYLLIMSLLGLGADLQIFITFTSTYIALLMVKILLKNYANTERRPTVAR